MSGTWVEGIAWGQWPLIALGGLLGSAHCVGMCGGFAVSIGLGTQGFGAGLRRQTVYSLGRVFTYAFLGALAGFAGGKATVSIRSWVDAQAVLSITAGLVLMVQGLTAAGWLRWPGVGKGAAKSPCLAGTFVGSFLTSPALGDVFVAGLMTGFLPCGLVYGYLALAAGSASLPAGAATMALFGAGTVPLMVLTGTGVSLLSRSARRHLFRVAAWCVTLTGILAVARGLVFALTSSASGAEACPGCL